LTINHATADTDLPFLEKQQLGVRFSVGCRVQKLLSSIRIMVFDASNGNQPTDSEADISMFDAFNDAALVDCCFLCFDSNVCWQKNKRRQSTHDFKSQYLHL
jgi:hypothetical protein